MTTQEKIERLGFLIDRFTGDEKRGDLLKLIKDMKIRLEGQIS